jgi:hypothetical protein
MPCSWKITVQIPEPTFLKFFAMNRFTPPENLLSILDSENTVAMTAPAVFKDRVLIGFAISPGESYCADLPLNEFVNFRPSLYLRVNAPRIFHGLKRIWEFMDQRG